MEKLALIGLLTGCAWAGAAVLGYPGVGWKPGAALAVVCAIWLVGRDGVSPEVIEGCATAVFLVLLFGRQWLFPRKPKGE